jgi:hypothetical protein
MYLLYLNYTIFDIISVLTKKLINISVCLYIKFIYKLFNFDFFLNIINIYYNKHIFKIIILNKKIFQK